MRWRVSNDELADLVNFRFSLFKFLSEAFVHLQVLFAPSHCALVTLPATKVKNIRRRILLCQDISIHFARHGDSRLAQHMRHLRLAQA
jgi:hypothetical protein